MNFTKHLLEYYQEGKTWYHATQQDFNTFDMKRGDIGAHFGTYEQARKRLKGRLKGSGQIYSAKIEVSNPLHLKDEGTFHAYGKVSDQLLKKGIISKEEHSRYTSNDNPSLETRTLHNEEIRNRLIEKGYDSIKYQNTHEGAGMSLIALKPESIKIVSKDA